MTLEQEHHHDNHRPVLLKSVLEILDPRPGERYLDLTAGYGGHAAEVVTAISPNGTAVLVDRDKNAVKALESLNLEGAVILRSDFLSAVKKLQSENQRFDMILADLGVSSPQLDNANRGFSIRNDGPLDMRMDDEADLTAMQLINELNEAELSRILKGYGEEPQAKRIASAIVSNRPILRTSQLANIVTGALKRPSFGSASRRKIHPATRTFQAIRIAVNDELDQIKQTLLILPDLLNEGGRLAIISFHSLEDRLVKQLLNDQSRYKYESTLKLLTKHPISGATEDSFHRRARSAKLRAAVKIKTKKERSTHDAH
ncbi:MAG: 16S rRNA (cytosine(1402)-N(4))-methyltransferase RsmH [Candidatus Saccharimonadales bacterium]|nr:16S rRNA (cytosine(1402)-N(4))-methyltransferase RsmH [Candidatus Saccharimonadales bacterium]